MIPGRPRCSAEALARGEALVATASLVDAWLLIEQPGAWGPDAVTESAFPAEDARPLLRQAAGAGVRVLMIRRRATQGGALAVFLAHSGDDLPSLRAGTVSDPLDLAGLDLGGMAHGQLPDFGTEVHDPIYLVCTHGRHDICCADKGRPLFRALSGLRPEQTWEVSHIGGDRFAGNVVVLPRGDYFGRVEADEAERLVDEYEAGRLDLEHHRGRSSQPRMVQAAEHFLRMTLGLPGFEDIRVIDYRRTGGLHSQVDLADPAGRVHRVRVLAQPAPESAFLTCHVAQAGRPLVYDLVSIDTG